MRMPPWNAHRSATVEADAQAEGSDKLAAGSVIGAHSLQHAYQHGFYVILPELYTTLALSPIAVAALETVRRVSSGAASMCGGFLLDRYQGKRIVVLYFSLIAMGMGYVFVGSAPNYVVIVVAVGLAGAAGSIWHPAALSLLSQRYPERRGVMVSLHRSSGSLGDVVGPLVVGGLMVVLAWQTILYAALPLALLFALVLWLVLRRASSWRALHGDSADRRLFSEQLRALWGVIRTRSLLMLLLVAGLSGLGQGGLLMWLGIYLRETQGMNSVGIGIHIALLTGFGIVAGPAFGLLSDRVGRKPVIVGVLAAKATFATLMGIFGAGILFSVSVALMGAVMFGVNSLIQAGALDLADGAGLEGSMIGLLWGSNALFVGAAPMIVAVLVQLLGIEVLFWYVAVVNVIALAAALLLPSLNRNHTAVGT